jgi:hypothetical protein
MKKSSEKLRRKTATKAARTSGGIHEELVKPQLNRPGPRASKAMVVQQ